MKKDKTTILKVLVGSRAHGLATSKSDYDYRAVYVLPTSRILSLGYKYKGTNWIEGNEDNTAYEIGHFLQLATKCNPTMLEVFKAPVIEINEDGKKLRELFPYVWNPKQAFDAFMGYGLNQRKKFLDKKDDRQNKYAVAYIRILWNLWELLKYETFNVEIQCKAVKNKLLEFKKGNYKMGEVIDKSEQLIEVCEEYLVDCKHESNLEKVNEFLVDIRRRYW